MNTQEMFDKGVAGVLAQGKRCVNASQECEYRHTDHEGVVTSCAVGFLITDEVMEEFGPMHGMVASDDKVREAIAASIGRELTSYEVNMLESLQTAHDNSYQVNMTVDSPDFDKTVMSEFLKRANETAHTFNLTRYVRFPS